MNEAAVSLKEWTQLLVDKLDAKTDARFTAAEAAVDKAAIEVSMRLESHNGLIRQMEKQSETFVSRVEFDAMKERLEDLRLSRSSGEGRDVGSRTSRDLAILIAGIAVTLFVGAVPIVVWFLSHGAK